MIEDNAFVVETVPGRRCNEAATTIARRERRQQERRRTAERTFMVHAGGAPKYRQKCDGVAALGYQGFTLR
jgi:hypothetical protein